MVNNLKNKKKKKGFTLIELIIVIAIIAILAAIAIPKFGDIRKNAALKADISNAKVIADATSALIADGKIGVKAASGTIGSSTDTLGDVIEGYLQNTPKPETTDYTSYTVSITADGNVTVNMVKGSGTGASSFALYPNASTATP